MGGLLIPLARRFSSTKEKRQSPDSDNPPTPPTPPMTKRTLFIEYNVIKDYTGIIQIIKEYKGHQKTQFQTMGGLWEG